MRTTAILGTLAVAAAPTLAQKGNLGFALGTKKADGSCKYTQDYEDDFSAIQTASGSTLVRGYAASDCNCAQQILPAAKNKGFKVILGIWPDTDASYAADKAAIQTYANQYADQVYAVTVGSETLYRGNFTGEQLLEKINDVKSILPSSVKIGTADSWNKYADGTADALIKSGNVDILLANAFSYWQGKEVGAGATYTYFDDVQQALGHVQSLSGSMDKIEFWNGETGWPTDGGTNYGPATASTSLASEFYSQAVCGMLDWGVNVFYFEAFDEPWKPSSVGDNGNAEDETHWGAMKADRSSKYSLKC
ncbi:glycoside hydrolase 3 protein [Friedmanniomyces endolithicus]|uniref:glucan 1,3-beta-glucosidase n=1 Tax=Friedmanniomyces endolithicus TaxID=329885 RepID=A0AAN6H9R8_9PEZI|nr:glycoside hydrolase 3 protein [Friedmanniomyces endolithicus]KAK0768550.1 glycoside hydrolase 3 protein [Friedmanniomyces endolithicus]KAK0783844.1 glycoside hydrolase 3 protein [Friedmanniomyces endolithicus]KAK0784914.1 glycoside hydrolase 3 protein [Friedmanniomyces endolithicus]KAK0825133.1 glycoside hydrolase 3 protein [Friedmanniomyces endolithicus]